MLQLTFTGTIGPAQRLVVKNPEVAMARQIKNALFFAAAGAWLCAGVAMQVAEPNVPVSDAASIPKT